MLNLNESMTLIVKYEKYIKDVKSQYSGIKSNSVAVIHFLDSIGVLDYDKIKKMTKVAK